MEKDPAAPHRSQARVGPLQQGHVDALLADHPDDVARTARRLRQVLLEGHPELAERVRTGWHSINYRDRDVGFVCALFPTRDRVQLVFEHGAAMPDPHGRLTGTGRQVRMLEFAAEGDLDPAMVLEYVDLALEIAAGLRAGRRAVRG